VPVREIYGLGAEREREREREMERERDADIHDKNNGGNEKQRLKRPRGNISPYNVRDACLINASEKSPAMVTDRFYSYVYISLPI